MEPTRIDPTRVIGWGIDADPDNDPTYPMKKRNNGEHAGYSWERPSLQPRTVEILHSNERPNVTAAFGTSSPPAGLSGSIRRMAFRYSESSYGHWLPLMFADRVDAVEGIVDDLRQGYVPNIPAEMGWRAELEHNTARVVQRCVLGMVLTALVVSRVRSRRRRLEQH